MSATNFFHCCANCGSAEDVSAGTTRCPGCGAPITPDEMDINAFTDLQEDLRNAYRAAEKHTQRALLLRVLKWMGDGPTALQLNESGIEEWLPKSDYDTLFQRYADVCAELAICKGPPAAAPVALGGEKGEAVAEIEPEFEMPVDRELFAFISGTPLVASLLYDINLLPEQITKPHHWDYMLAVCGHMKEALAAPVGKARMLTDEEADHITGMHNTGRAQGDSECAEAIQRKFCEVNGITLEGGNRSGG